MSELIERQAVIDLWDRYHHTIAVDAMHYDAELRQLPSAQPTQLTDDDIETIRVHLSAIKENLCNQHRWNEAKEYEALIDRLTAQPEPHYDEWCTDCKEYDKERHCCPRWNKVIRQTLTNTQPEPCEDAVSREAVLDALRTCYDTETITYDNGDEYIHYGDAVGEVEQLPPVTPKQRTGKWLINCDGYYPYCSECRIEPKSGVMTDFCPNCGAKMLGVYE